MSAPWAAPGSWPACCLAATAAFATTVAAAQPSASPQDPDGIGDARPWLVTVVRDGAREVVTFAPPAGAAAAPVGFLLLLPAGAEPRVTDVAVPESLARLERGTAPVFVAVPDRNPCRNAVPGPAAERQVAATLPYAFLPATYTAKAAPATAGRQALEAWLGTAGLAPSAHLVAVIARETARGAVALLVTGTPGSGAIREGARRYLSPVQVTFASERFLVPWPVGLGAADETRRGDLDGRLSAVVLALTQGGRVTPTDGPPLSLDPRGLLPVLSDRGARQAYDAALRLAARRADGTPVLLEWSGPARSCQTCGTTLNEDLPVLGATWLRPPVAETSVRTRVGNIPMPEAPQATREPGTAPEVVVTRLRLTLPPVSPSLVLDETEDRDVYSSRFLMVQPWTGLDECLAAAAYRRTLPRRLADAVERLSRFTGWNAEDARARLEPR